MASQEWCQIERSVPGVEHPSFCGPATQICDRCACRPGQRRTLYTIGRTRIHLDVVEQLGRFIELEVVLADAELADAGVAEAKALTAMPGIGAHQLIHCAYIDLLARR